MRSPITLLATVLLLIQTMEPGAAMDTSEDPDSLSDTSWTLSALQGTVLLPDVSATLHFAAGHVQGSDGCNRYSASFKGDAGQFQVSGPLLVTNMACPDPVMKQADAFTRALATAQAVRIDADQLILLDAAGAVLASLTRQSTDLAGTTWLVIGYNNGKQAVASVVLGSSLTLTFSADGKLAGSAGCNQYNAGYTASGQAISVGRIAATRMMCAHPEGVMEQESAYLQALEKAAVARIDGDRLELRSTEGALLVTASRQRDTAAALGPATTAGAAAPSTARADQALQRPVAVTGHPPDTLVSDGDLAATEPYLILGGEMQYMADAARFTECLTRRSYPIAMEADFIKLQEGYRSAASAPGALLYVTIEGSIAARPRMEGEGTEPSVIVRRFINAWPEERCERARAHASLTNTAWRIVRLGDEAVSAAADQREPRLIMRHDGDQAFYKASVGCNQLMGGYRIEGATISLMRGPTTLMACPPPLDVLERKLEQALAATQRWHIQGNTLEFLDANGVSVALFAAVYL